MRHGARILARNIQVGRGELDLIVRLGGQRVVVEVKTTWRGEGGLDDAAYAFTQHKADQVRRLASRLGVRRVDLVTVALGEDGADIRWVLFAA